MSVFKIEIAKHVIEVNSLYNRIFDVSKKFLTTKEPCFSIHITEQDVVNERIAQGLEGNDIFPDDQIEVLSILRKISDAFIEDNIILMHGAAISVNEKGFIFSAKSGTGKTVHSIRWLLNCKDTIIVNGDKPFIDINNEPMICGSPWSGKEGRHHNMMVPLKSIILLKRADENHIEQISFAQAFPILLQQIYMPGEEEKMRRTIRLIQRLASYVTFYRFHCNNYKNDCFDVAYNALIGNQL